MHEHFDRLQPYPFQRLKELLAGVTPEPSLDPIALSIGEPKHAAPEFVRESLVGALDDLEIYPTTGGTAELKQAIGRWLSRRFSLPPLEAEQHILPVNGTREAIFAFVQAMYDRRLAEHKPYVVMPNPFYQIYEGAAYLAGAEPHLLPCLAEQHFNPDYYAVPDDVWARTQILFLCSPGNPTGAVVPLETLEYLLGKAEEHDFIVASDECYSEIYFTEKERPIGLLEACRQRGDALYRRAMVFHSLSKRSNLPGLRSGFVAGDPELIRPFLRYRTYQGGAMPVQVQKASALAWQEESHVEMNRTAYREKFRRVLSILDGVMDVQMPDAGFYLWAGTPISDTEFARRLYQEQHVTVLPGSYVGREIDGVNPGANRVRMALVAGLSECEEAARRIRAFCESL
ncbi:MAG: succinyldiaminopimelate transaminase [Natronospirillum sp.]|uniref:succinyldiaminopimelate transaminase n=1 Tax=Natronospirillum sp. TaxID=2812955 RepID=UPI0025DE225D|nr:succinyldiaminopimelate transaminase [Natronospirillum sp.]MCH8552975.1 succinyldiaminopimelate transaminase [Natronospirillum sp.]